MTKVREDHTNPRTRDEIASQEAEYQKSTERKVTSGAPVVYKDSGSLKTGIEIGAEVEFQRDRKADQDLEAEISSVC